MNNFLFFDNPDPLPIFRPENPNPYGDYEDDINE